MDADEFRWRQSQQLCEFLRFIGTQGMVWFGFGCTINATSAWALIGDHVKLKTYAVHITIIVCDLFAVIACIFLRRFYKKAHARLSIILNEITTMGGTDAAVRSPAFPVDLFRIVTGLMAIDYFLFAALWLVGIAFGTFPLN